MHSTSLRPRFALILTGLLSFPAAAQDQVFLHDTAPLSGAVHGDLSSDTLEIDCDGWRVRAPMARVAAVRIADGALHVPLADHAEDLALVAANRGEHARALDLYAKALHQVVLSSRAAPLGERADVLIEVYLRRLQFFAGKDGGSPLDVIEAATEVIESPSVSPYAQDVALRVRADQLRALGRDRLARADELAQGVLDAFYVLGAFDNERGTGFDKAYPPETQPFDPKASFEGKKHQVSWRALSVAAPPDGVIDLDALMRPNDQALAYAVTYLHAENEVPVALRFGSDEAAKIWVNGREVLSRNLRRSQQPDQDHVGVVLAKGWNQILVKVCDQTGGWRFRLRVNAPAGGPARGVRRATLAEIAEAPAVPAKAETTPLAAPGSIALASKQARENARDWRAWFYLGYLQLTTGAHDQTEHPDREAFQTAISLQAKGDSPQIRSALNVFLSFANTAGGEFSVNREDNARRAALEAALETDPQNLFASVLLAGYYANQLGNHDKARSLLAPVLAEAPGYLDARLMLLDLDQRRGRGPLVKAELERLYQEAVARYRAEEVPVLPAALLRRILALASASGDVRRQQELLEQLLETDRGNTRWISTLADLHERAGRHDVALGLRRRALDLEPFELDLRTRLTDHLARLDRFDEAALALEAALSLAPQDDDLLEALGHVLDRQGQTQRADALYQRAMALNPNRVDLKKYLDYRARKQEKARIPFEDAWVVDPAPLAAKVQVEALDARRTHRTLFRQEVARVHADGTKSEFVQEVIRVENRIGAQQLASYAAFYQSDQHLEFQRARVFFKDGRVEDAPVGASRGRTRGEFTSGRRYSVSFPPLTPGDVIAVRYRVDDLGQGFFGDYYGKTAYFQQETRLDWMRYVLIAPQAKQLYFHTPGLTDVKHERSEQGEWVVHRFEKRGVAPLESEPNMPWAKETLPQVQVSTFKDWDAFSRWYWGLVSSQHEADDQMKAKVAELVKGAKTTEEKVRRIYNYVVTDIRYNASWEFGIHGFKPYNATKIFARKFGDCKDKATLIDTMLKVIGVEAWPVLIFGQDRRGLEDLSLPLMNHFNHCISWVNLDGDRQRGGIFLDGTAEHHPYATLPTMDYGATVVVITPEKGVVREIPFQGPEANTIKEHHQVKVEHGGKATLQTLIEGSGTYGVILRDILQSEGRRKEVLEPQIGKSFGGAHVKAVRTSDLSNLDLPAKVEIDVDLPKVLSKTPDGGWELNPVRSWLFDAVYLRGTNASNLAADSERTQDVILAVPSGVEEDVTYELPPDMRIERLPKATRLDLPFGSYELEYTQDGPRVRVRRKLRFKTNRIPVKDYPAFRKFVRDIDRAEAERPVLEGKGGEQ